MPRSFYERRHDFREPVDEGTVTVAARSYRLVNWSVGGFLAVGAPPLAPGGVAAARFDLNAGGARFAFDGWVRVVRAGDPPGSFAGQFERLEAADRDVIHRHFDPFGAVASASAGTAYAVAPPAPPPPPPPEPPPLSEEPMEAAAELCVEWGRNTLEAESADPHHDTADLRRQLSRLKAAVARRYHPDAVAEAQERVHRAEIFARVWAQLEEIEAGLVGGAVAKDPQSGNRIG